MTTRGSTSIEKMSIVELFSRAKSLQQAVAAKVGEESEVITIDTSDSELECDGNSTCGDRSACFSCGQAMIVMKLVVKSLMKGMMNTKIVMKI